MRIREHADRKNRECNIMVYNLEESANANLQIRKDKDLSRFHELCLSLDTDVKIKTAFRIGKKERESCKTL